ncbi:GlsB/YeaQ/YmgE family stress response membrane protein [Paenibacillus agricola]|uniref:GlsB/YeaQ/YmgE family stress response membrane protein n=1 Tax=Paenibacillus agricola TaxID=2716264 RepID=A0ABX0JGL0_9BACL|nr:GlsB/YeaQ/YmgE family stress response membrane protein [Paenibacillus agricola]NHN35297.1 GlsB/YeaQ/YmgE family stress response membrane protein [Paenibacillus agricola]
MEFLWMLIVGGVIGWLAQVISHKNFPGGIIGNIVAGILGSWLGAALLGSFGPVVGGFYIVPAIIGAIILVFLFSLIIRSRR